MARDRRATIAALERKAADRATTGPEAEALRAKAAELRSRLPGGTTGRTPGETFQDILAEMQADQARARDDILRTIYDAFDIPDTIRWDRRMGRFTYQGHGENVADDAPGSPGWRRGTGF